MGTVEDRLSQLGLALPAPFAAPPGMEFRFDVVRVHGGLAYVSGHLPMDGERVLVQGKVDADVSVDEAHEAARQVGLSILASLKQELGDLDRVRGWVKALGLVNCSPGFSKTPAVVNGFSELILELWGESGRHARSAIGVAELPFDAPVEIEAVAEVA